MSYQASKVKVDTPLSELLEKDPYNIDYNRLLLAKCTRDGEYGEIKRYGRELFRKALDSGYTELEEISAAYLSWAYLLTGHVDSLDLYLPMLHRLCENDTMTAIGLMANNILAIRAINTGLDYSAALRHFNKGLKIAREHNDTINMSVFLTNISNIYSIREDPAGIAVAEEAYLLCHDSGESQIIINSTLNLADLLLLQNRYQESEKYAEEALALAKRTKRKQQIGRCYLIEACVAYGLGDAEGASEYFAYASRYMDYSDVEVQIKYYIKYAEFLLQTGRNEEAIRYFSKGLEMKGCTPEQKMKALPLLSQAYSRQGMDRNALESYKKYHRLSDSLSFYQKEQAFNNLRMQLEQAKYVQRLVEKELTIERREHDIVLIVLLAVLLVLTAVGIILLQVRRNRMYKQLVEQHQQHMLIARKMKETQQAKALSVAPDGAPNPETQKERELYEQIESLMTVEKIYRWNDLTLDKLCETLHSNRSYVSKVINNYSGMNFVNYVNYKRIEEATEILSDPEDDMPLKVLSDNIGYNSISTFYRAFQKETGCSPSRYREEIRKQHQ